MGAMSSEEIKFEQHGLLTGLSGEPREARIELLEELADDGFTLEQLKQAVSQGRLPLLWVERRLSGEAEYSAEEVAEAAGVSMEMLERLQRSLGMVGMGGGSIELGEDEVEAAKRARRLMDAGLDQEAIEGIARVIAVSMSQFAAAVRQTMAESLIEEGDTELTLARRFDEVTKTLGPMVGPMFDHAFQLHLRQQLRHTAIDAVGVGSEEDDGEQMAVAFADLVDFTSLGEQVPPEELGRVTGRLDALARDAAVEPIRLVKMVGDAAMFVSPDSAALVTALLDLLEAAEAEGEEFPVLRAGIARGQLVQRAGDIFGRSVNLADRITGIARPGSVLVGEELVEELEEDFDLSDAGRKRLKGISEKVRVYRCRRLEPTPPAEDG